LVHMKHTAKFLLAVRNWSGGSKQKCEGISSAFICIHCALPAQLLGIPPELE